MYGRIHSPPGQGSRLRRDGLHGVLAHRRSLGKGPDGPDRRSDQAPLPWYSPTSDRGPWTALVAMAGLARGWLDLWRRYVGQGSSGALDLDQIDDPLPGGLGQCGPAVDQDGQLLGVCRRRWCAGFCARGIRNLLCWGRQAGLFDASMAQAPGLSMSSPRNWESGGTGIDRAAPSGP